MDKHVLERDFETTEELVTELRSLADVMERLYEGGSKWKIVLVEM